MNPIDRPRKGFSFRFFGVILKTFKKSKIFPAAAATTAKSAAANRPPGRRGGRAAARPLFPVAGGG